MNKLQLIFNRRVLHVFVFACCLASGMLYFVVLGAGNTSREEALTSGIRQGQLMALTSTMQLRVEDAVANETSPLPNLSGETKLARSTATSIQLNRPNSPILAFLTPLVGALDEYAAKTGKADIPAARAALQYRVLPATKALNQTLDQLFAKIPTFSSQQRSIEKFIFIFFIVSAGATVLVFAELIPKLIFSDKVEWHHHTLDGRLLNPIVLSLGKAYSKSIDKEDEAAQKVVGALIMAGMLSPSSQHYASLKKDATLGLPVDVRDELKTASAYASLLSAGKSHFDLPPQGLLQIKGDFNALSYALIHWMYELNKDQNVEIFNLTYEQVGDAWQFTLATSDKSLSTKLVSALQAILSKPRGIDKDHHDSLDFVRAVLRTYAKDVKVSDRNGNIELSFSIPSRNNA